MCTAISFKTKDHYFGRNLDLELSYNETVTVMPRRFRFPFKRYTNMDSHYAMIGMATVVDSVPLYYDATNEKGLSMAALNFPENAVYRSETEGKDNITPYEFIPWILGQCSCISEARKLLERLNLISIPFNEKLPITPLHWIISDRESSITVESVEEGLNILDNPVGVLTNNPPFEYHITNLNNYLNLTADIPANRFAPSLELTPYSRGMGAIGLPGDLSSSSRFVRTTFMKFNSVCDNEEEGSVSQFFHILAAAEHPRGSVRLGEGKYQITVYSSCCNTDRGIYYFNTYDNHTIRGIDMNKCDLDSEFLYKWSIGEGGGIAYLN